MVLINFTPPTLIYNVTKPIRSTIFNFNNVISEVNIDDSFSDPNYFPCNCNNLPYFHKDHANVLKENLQKTGDN